MISFKGYTIEIEADDLGYFANYWKTGQFHPFTKSPVVFSTKCFRRNKTKATADAKQEIRQLIASEKAQNIVSAKL
jgi:hypothetical protein